MGRTVVISACTGYITTDEDVADTAGEWAPSIPLPFTSSPLFVLLSNERASARSVLRARTEIDFAIEI